MGRKVERYIDTAMDRRQEDRTERGVGEREGGVWFDEAGNAERKIMKVCFLLSIFAN